MRFKLIHSNQGHTMIGHSDMWSGIKNSEKKATFWGDLILVKVSEVRVKLLWVIRMNYSRYCTRQNTIVLWSSKWHNLC